MGGRIPCRLRAAWHNMDLELRWRLRAQPEQLMKYLNFLRFLKDKQRKQAARAGSLFNDVMTSDLLMHFLRGPAFVRVAILSHELRSAAKVLALAYHRTRRQTPGVFCMHRRITHTAQAACSMCSGQISCHPVQHVCIPKIPLPEWKLMLKEKGLLPERSGHLYVATSRVHGRA